MLIETVKTFIVKSLLRLLSWIPLPLLHRLAGLIGALVYVLPTETRRVTLINLQRVFPELALDERKRLARRSIQETLKAGFELGHMWYGSVEHAMSLIKGIQGKEYIDDALASGRSIIYCSPHLGNWELMGLYVSTLAPLTTLYKPPKLTGLNDLIADARARAGADLVATDRAGVVKLTRALQQGASTGILPDQQPREGGVFAPFFGHQAYTMTLVSKLAARSNAVVLFTFARRLPGGTGFELICMPADADIAHADSSQAAAALNRSVEACVRLAPEQYQWEYKRFRKRPTDETEPFY
ncbi:MAG: lysophospholipid acyltransferase family protein [Pseudohongiella sp.]|uniref:lysophospholipid acyltransferase family protein n=1 Tax=Pseudohongiella sp. TaxID=1979412 RepID=UPI0034A02A0C